MCTLLLLILRHLPFTLYCNFAALCVGLDSHTERQSKVENNKNVFFSAVGFEPTPLRTGA